MLRVYLLKGYKFTSPQTLGNSVFYKQ